MSIAEGLSSYSGGGEASWVLYCDDEDDIVVGWVGGRRVVESRRERDGIGDDG